MRKMKLGILFLATLFTAQTTFAQPLKTCSEEYAQNLNSSILTGDTRPGKVIAQGFIVGSLGMLGAVSKGANMGTGFAIGAGLVATGHLIHGGVVALTNIKEKKMIRLIDEASAYKKGIPAGKVLKKMHKKISKHLPDVTLADTAKFVTAANESGDLCKGENLMSFGDIKRGLKKRSLTIDMYDYEQGYNEGYDQARAQSAQVDSSERESSKEREIAATQEIKGSAVGQN